MVEQKTQRVNSTPQADRIDLLELTLAVLKRWWALVIALIIGAGLGFLMNDIAVTPMYEADVLLYVNNGSISLGSTSISLSDMTASSNLVDSYIVILNSRSVLKRVIEEANLNYSMSELKSMYSASAVNDTPALSIVVTDSDINEGILIANTTADVLSDEITRVIDGTSVEIIDYAATPESAVTLGHFDYMIRGAFIAFVLCVAILVLLELRNDSIKSEDDLLKNFKYPILSTVPDHAKHTNGSYGGYYSSKPSKKKSKNGVRMKEKEQES